MWLLYVSLGSRFSTSILWLISMHGKCGIVYPRSASCMLYSTGSGVNRVHVVLSGLRMRLFVCLHVCISCRYD